MREEEEEGESRGGGIFRGLESRDEGEGGTGVGGDR